MYSPKRLVRPCERSHAFMTGARNKQARLCQPGLSQCRFTYPVLTEALDERFVLVPECFREAVAELVEEGGDERGFFAPDFVVDAEQA